MSWLPSIFKKMVGWIAEKAESGHLTLALKTRKENLTWGTQSPMRNNHGSPHNQIFPLALINELRSKNPVISVREKGIIREIA